MPLSHGIGGKFHKASIYTLHKKVYPPRGRYNLILTVSTTGSSENFRAWISRADCLSAVDDEGVARDERRFV